MAKIHFFLALWGIDNSFFSFLLINLSCEFPSRGARPRSKSPSSTVAAALRPVPITTMGGKKEQKRQSGNGRRQSREAKGAAAEAHFCFPLFSPFPLRFPSSQRRLICLPSSSSSSSFSKLCWPGSGGGGGGVLQAPIPPTRSAKGPWDRHNAAKKRRKRKRRRRRPVSWKRWGKQRKRNSKVAKSQKKAPWVVAKGARRR